MMLAVVLEQPGTFPRLQEWPEPPDSVPVLAAGVNPVDLVMAGPMFDAMMPFPRVVGMEAVVDVDGVPAYAEMSVPAFGSFAEKMPVRPGAAIPLPAGIEPAHALSFGIAGLAAWLSLEGLARLAKGETVAVLGATGAVGQIAVQAAKALGAAKVVAVGRDQETLDRLVNLGADVALRFGPDIDREVAEATKRGADVVIDMIGTVRELAVAASTATGRIVAVGAAGVGYGHSHAASAPTDSSLGRRAWIPYNGFDFDHEQRSQALLTMCRLSIAGAIEARIETFPLEAASEAWEQQATSPRKKLVLLP